MAEPAVCGRNGIVPWLERFTIHGNGVCLTPDRTSAPWFQKYAARMDSLLFVTPKIKFIRPDGTQGRSPSSGTALMAMGEKGAEALRRSSPKLGLLVKPQGVFG